MTRACTRCGEPRAADEYPKPKSRICTECQRKAKNQYRRENLADHNRQYRRQWNADNPGKSASYTRKWQANNPDAYGDYMRENPWAQRIYNARRRAQKAQVPVAPFKSRELVAAWESAGLVAEECVYCSSASTGIDHIVPFTLGGGHFIENCVPACGGCNSSKHGYPLELWLEICTLSRLRPDALDRIYAYRTAVLACA